MENEIEKIQYILKNIDEETQKKILLECAQKLGTNEWQEAVKELMRRMGIIK